MARARVLAMAAALAAGLSSAGCGDASADDEESWDEEEDESADIVDVAIGVVLEASFGDDDDGDGRSRPAATPWRSARRDLLRDPADPEGSLRGYVEVRKRGPRERFRVCAGRLEPFAAAGVQVSDGSGGMLPAGTVTADESGTAVWEAAADRGDPLPSGAGGLRDLAGRRVEVRDAAGLPLLVGRVPFLSARGGRSASAVYRDGITGAAVRVDLLSRGGGARQAMRVAVAGLEPHAEAVLQVADRGGAHVASGSLVADPDGRARFLFDSRRGDPLPAGVLDLVSLGGRGFEVRSGGKPAVGGEIPRLR